MAVQLSTFDCQSSATSSQACAESSSPFRRAMSAAATNPAISAAIVPGDQPSWFSQRSWGLSGPFATTKSAAGLTCSV